MNHSKIFSEGNIGCIMRGIFSNIINTLGMCVFFEDIRCIYSHPYSGLDVKEIPTPMLTMTSFDALLAVSSRISSYLHRWRSEGLSSGKNCRGADSQAGNG
ncbi:uncharacterized protein LOC124685105 isoform X1 [Lolium rigidum]|uniref:uncharacterized protein LOC124685105 isoform X1 n=1 Tax=Lolium rigidum TaxID=89674 RepID=UPI001F5D760C|nr:uncharacterized protein LOC124685105 isoform X1 [Lolium rigidum]